MTRRINKVEVNAPCPCGSLRKYKICCRGRVDWETIGGFGSEWVRHLSTRGKNKLFMTMVLDALQIDTDRGAVDLPSFKRAFTSSAVKKIHEAVAFVWPDGEDLKRILAQESKATSGLYIGRYEPDLITRGVTRHSLYADRILLIDPLLHPRSVREDLNPALHPEQHRTATLKWITLWVQMLPWIEEGIVGFVRCPGNFYPDLAGECIAATERRFARHPEFEDLREEMLQEEKASPSWDEFRESLHLSMPDRQIRDEVRKKNPTISDEDLDGLIQHVHDRRDNHPYFLEPEPGQTSELHQMSTGTNYEEAKLIALHSRSYVMTDLPTRWREIELDRSDSGVDPQEWAAFAKAFQGLPFRFLDSVPINAALALRNEGRLDSMRSFLRKTWKATSSAEPFDASNVANLAAELNDRVAEAEIEWRVIDQDLVKLITAETAAGIVALGPAIATGHAKWLGAAAVATGIGNVIQSTMKRGNHRLKYPAGFFVDLKKGKYDS